MGVVYEAEHVDLQKKVALKLLAGSVASRSNAVERFRREARAASGLGSPYIADVTDFGRLPDGREFFVMEYLAGTSLRAALDAGGALPAGRAIAILRQIAKALGAAHEKGVIHLDVKPDNVMLVARGRRTDAVKMVDFGVAGLLTEGRQEAGTSVVSGTPAYLAPERVLRRGYDHRSDIYSLGVTAYETLTGNVPFEGEDMNLTMRMHVQDPPEPLRLRRPDGQIPPALERLVLEMLAKHPEERPQNMVEVEARLCEAQIAHGITTTWDDLELPPVDEERRARIAERMPSPRSRRARRVLGAALSVAALAIAAAVYLGAYRKNVVLVEVTRTEEPPSVAEPLALAARAAREQRYTSPPEDAALRHIERAEDEAARLGLESPGARTLRLAYAGALAVVGDNLLQAGLGDLAVAKFKEALLFDPSDPDLRRKAELTPAERQALDQRPPRPSGQGASRRNVTPVDRAKTIAASLFVAAQEGQFSVARAQTAALLKLDGRGTQAARLADALRPLARAALSEERPEEGRSLYRLIAALDPADLEARERLRAPPVSVPPVAKSEAATPAAAPAQGPKLEARDTFREAPRDVEGARRAAAEGRRALGKGKLPEAEIAFRRAVSADPLNAVAIGGLAEVAFEGARYPEALDWSRRAVRLAPRSAKFLTILGDCYFKLLRYADADAAYRRALRHTPDDERIRSRMARVKERLTSR